MKFCKKCGTEIKKGVEYCPKCGNLIEWNEPSEINKYLDKNRNTLKWIIYVLGYVYYIWSFRNIESWGELRGISWFIILSAWYLFVNKKIIDKLFYTYEKYTLIQQFLIYAQYSGLPDCSGTDSSRRPRELPSGVPCRSGPPGN